MSFEYPYPFKNFQKNYLKTINNKSIDLFDLTKYSKEISRKELNHILSNFNVDISEFHKNHEIPHYIIKFMHDYIHNIMFLIKNIDNVNEHLEILYNTCFETLKATRTFAVYQQGALLKSTDGVTKRIFRELFFVIKLLIDKLIK